MNRTKSSYDPREVFRQIIDINPDLDYKKIMKVTEKPERTVFKWLSGSSAPDMFSLYLLQKYLSAAGLNIPRDLYRIVNLHTSRAVYHGKADNKGDSPVLVGEKKHKKFIYSGELLSIREIEIKSGKNQKAISKISKPYGDGDDITHQVDNLIPGRGPGRPRKKETA